MTQKPLRRCLCCRKIKPEYYENSRICEDCARLMDEYTFGGEMNNKPIHQHEEDNDYLDYLMFGEEEE